MKFNILSIGKFKDKNCEELFLEYKKRMDFSINLKELTLKKNYEGEKLKEEEGKLLLQNVGKNAKLIVLDERGKIITTPDFHNLIIKFIGIYVKRLTYFGELLQKISDIKKEAI